ncbi:MAG: monovalent cation/H+ antiporter subunit D family protein [Proteobacteria bacterium]|nr:monovalent cation/H+ antiporter subunit D family protein [Pseudomonadota bacterium]
MPHFITLCLMLGLATPLVVAGLAWLFGKHPNLRDCLGPLGGVITLGAALIVAQDVLGGNTPEWHLFTISASIDFAFRVTPLGALFGVVASGMWVMASMYSVGYMRGGKESHQTRFAVFYAIAIFAAMAIAWSGNLLMLFIFYEILTFSTYPLVIHKQTNEAMGVGRLYLAMLLSTSLLLFLPALVWVWLVAGTLDFTPGGILAGRISNSEVVWLLLLFVLGIGKAAIMPLHRWLPAAMVAPTPVSALLHAVAVVKAGVFSILTAVVYIIGGEVIVAAPASVWVVWLACATILLSSIVAIQKDDLKARLAYSTISQLAYIILGATLASQLAIIGAGLHIAMHASAKITLFFCAGAFYVMAHKTKVSELDGLGYQMPLVFIAFAIGALSIIGLPPLGGTWSKFYLMAGAAERGLVMVIIVLAISSLLNLYYLLEPVVRGFMRKPLDKTVPSRLPLMVIPPVITAILSLWLFFVPWPFAPLARLMGGS